MKKLEYGDFEKDFTPSHYISEYYSDLGSENKAILDFLHRSYERIGPQKIFSALEMVQLFTNF